MIAHTLANILGNCIVRLSNFKEIYTKIKPVTTQLVECVVVGSVDCLLDGQEMYVVGSSKTIHKNN